MPRPPGSSASQPARSAPPALSLQDFRAGLNSPPFSLIVPEGQTVTAYGTDPVALSSLLDRIAGFSPALGGHISVQGENVTSKPAGHRKISLISPRDPLFPHLNLADNIALPLRARKQDKATARATASRIISLTGLDGLNARTPRNLSPEHHLRALIARALITNPAILLLDDLYSTLTTQSSQRIASLLEKLSRALSLSVLQTVSRKEDALRAGSHIALFHGNTLLQAGTAAELYDRPADAHVATLFGETNALTGQILDIVDDVARIRLACGGVIEALAFASELECGVECVVCIRPDRVSPFFGPQNFELDDDLPPVRGALADSTHLGDHIRMRVRCPDGTEIELRRPPVQSQKIPRAGTPVQLAWPAAHATAFPLQADLY